jgi:type IV pilus assembly protein PilB
MKDDYMSRVIDLPVSPLRSTLSEGNLHDAPVIASLMNGKTVAGRLQSLDGPQRFIELVPKNAAQSQRIAFSELRALTFVTQYPVNRAPHPLQTQSAQIRMPHASQNFRVIFIDRKTLSGRTRGSFVDEVGIHLFQLVDSGHVRRLFIPIQIVHKYYIGERKPTEIRRTIESMADERPAGKDGARPKRRKADMHNSGAVAATRPQLQEAIERLVEQGHVSGAGTKRFGEMLVEEGIITAEQLESALEAQKREPSVRLGEILLRMGTVAAEDIYPALAHKFGMPFVLLRNFFVDLDCLKLVPANVARKYMLVPLLVHKDRLIIAMDDPTNTEPLTVLRFMTRYRIEPTIATRDDILWAIGKYYGPARGDQPPAASRKDPTPLKREEETVATFIHETIRDAVKRGASDVHIVCGSDFAEMLFRINGALTPIRRFSKVLIPAIMQRLRGMTRLGNLSNVGIGTQQGQARVLSGDNVVGLHIFIERDDRSERAVIRLLDTGTQLKHIGNLGLRPADLQRLMEILNKTFSLLIVTGPRDSGRREALYAVLRSLRETRLNIATVESPIQCHIDGIEQRHADNDQEFKRGLDEARAAKPDVLMIGAIDNAARFKLAMEAALGGSLVLAALDAGSTVTAMADMLRMDGVHHLLHSTLAGVLTPYPVRLNCKFCMTVEETDAAMRSALGIDDDEEVFYRGRGCKECSGTGYSGEQLIFELLAVTPETRGLIAKGAPVGEIYRQAVADGMTPAVDEAIGLARSRRISLSEAYRVFERTRAPRSGGR